MGEARLRLWASALTGKLGFTSLPSLNCQATEINRGRAYDSSCSKFPDCDSRHGMTNEDERDPGE
jgi:hypothetical protein